MKKNQKGNNDNVTYKEARVYLDEVSKYGSVLGLDTVRELLRELFLRADGRIDLMAGAGVKQGTIQELAAYTGIRVFHTSARTGPVDSGMTYRKETVSMGLPSLSEYELWRTDEEEFRACAELVHAL